MIGLVQTATQAETLAEKSDSVSDLGRGRVTEPALHRGWQVLILVLFFAGYLLQYPILVLTGIFFLVFRYGSSWYSRRALLGVGYRRDFSQRRTFPGEETVMTIQISNRKRLPVSWLAAVDHWSGELPVVTSDGQRLADRPSDLVTLLFSLRGREQVGRSYRIRPEQRGIYPFGPVSLGAGDPFGLFTNRSHIRTRDWLVVYPRVLPIDELELPYQAPFGDVSARHSIFQDPVRTVGVRDYHPSDSFRRVHWKASARRQNLQVRVFEPTTAYTMILVLNVATFTRHWEGMRPEILERAVCATASIANYAHERRWMVGVTANGAMPNADQPIRVPPGRGPDQLSFVLEALAGVTSFTTSPFERFLLSESSRLAWGATLVVVSAVVTDEVLASLNRLRIAGRRVVLVSLTAEPPAPPPGLLTFHIPHEGLAFDPAAAYGKAQLIPIEAQPTSRISRRRRAYSVSPAGLSGG